MKWKPEPLPAAFCHSSKIGSLMSLPPTPLSGTFSTVLDVFDAVLSVAPSHDAFVLPSVDGPTQRLSFIDWATRSDALAGWLQEHGVKKGDVVGIQLPSGLDYAIAYQAIVRTGAIATGINPRLGSAEINHIHQRCEPVYVFDGDLPQCNGGDPMRRRVAIDANDPVAIVWTGGTTGYPKGAWFDHACLEAMSHGAAPLSAIGDRRLSPLPFAHVGAMTRVWDELMHLITTVIAPFPWTPAGALSAIGSEKVTVCQGVPTQYRMMFDHQDFTSTDTSHLRIAGIGAARIPTELVIEMREKLACPVVVRYASTEACLATGTRLDDDIKTICTTVGRPNGTVEMRIVAKDGSLCELNQVGTVQLRSRAIMRGYWKEPELTAQVITPDGWLVTGDLGGVGADGNLRLAGRTTEMYIRGGYNVYPIEIENALGAHPDITGAAVVGASVQDRLGEIGILFAVARADATLNLTDIRSFTKQTLADYKAPDALVVVKELPLTSLGKVDKKQLQMAAEQEAAKWVRQK